jgi:hypothetical protein
VVNDWSTKIPEIPTMAENPDNDAGDNEKTLPGGAQPQKGEHESEAKDSDMSSNLPMVVAPKLGAGEEEVEETADAPAGQSAAPAAQAHSARFLVLAATVAFAAAFGSFIGSVSGLGLARYIDLATPATNVDNTSDAMREMKLELAELSTLKASLDNAAHNTTSQFAKIADRLDRLDPRSGAASETTASIAPQTSASAAPAPGGPPATLKLSDKILSDWVVDEVLRNGRALIESRYGALFEVGAGSVLPGLGHVDTIKRQDGQWMVLTERGIITSGR